MEWFNKNIKKYFTPLCLIYISEIVAVVLASLGFAPRETILFWTGLAIFYILFSPLEDSLWLIVASIPLYVALPLSDSFDTMANWRILLIVLSICLFLKQGFSLKNLVKKDGWLKIKENLRNFSWFEASVAGFLFWGLLSLLVANYPVLVLKKFLFLINIFLLFFVIRKVAKTKEAIIKIWQAAATGGSIVLAVALCQIIAVLIIPLASFWQFWANKISRTFYGNELAHLLSFSNTWFAYYKNNPPTLRLFSVFPDSHSFALFCVLLVPIFLSLAFYFRNQEKIYHFYWLLTALALGGVALSGSRGTWVAVIPAILVALYLYLKKIDSFFLNKILKTFFLFIVLFTIISLFWPPTLYLFEAWQEGKSINASFSFFERARSVSDFNEISNKGRLEIWQRTIHSIARHPLFGVGWGNYAEVLDENISVAKKGASAHSLYLDIAAEMGLPGLFFLIALFYYIFYTAWLVWHSQNESFFYFFGLFFGVYFIWVSVYGFFDVVLLNDKVLLFFMVLIASLYILKNFIYSEKTVYQKD